MSNIQQIFQLASNKDALCIFNIYTFLCKNIINKNFIITNEEVSMIFNYFEEENNLEIKSSDIWNNYSIQKEIFDATIYFIQVAKTLDYSDFNNNFLLLLKYNNFSEFIITVVEKNLKNIYYIYLNSFSIFLEKDYHFFKDNFFEFYFISTINEYATKNSFFSNDCFSVRFILEGSVKYKKNIFCSKGDLLICDKNFFLEEYTILTPVYSEVIFIIKPDFISSLGISIPNFDFKKLSFSFNQKNLEFILNKEPITAKNYFNLQFLAIYTLNLILNPWTEILDKNDFDLKSHILKIISNNINLSDTEIIFMLSEYLEVSTSKFYQLFKKYFNSTPSKIVQKLKIDFACFLLISTEKTIEDISYSVGYNESTFYKKFNSLLNTSPSLFKKQIWRN